MPLRLMCLTAHPDDEAGGFGGLLLRSAERGAQTAVLCLTEGSAGSYRELGQSDEELAQVRRGEFKAACAALGVQAAHLLRYPDGELRREPFLPLVGVLVEAIRRFRPHVLATFGSDGGVNLHRDHTLVSLAGTAAFHWAGRSDFFSEQFDKLKPWAPQKLYYAATQFLSTSDEEAKRTGARVPATLTYRLGELKERKLAAFAEHTSQRDLLARVRDEFDRYLDEENFRLAAARSPDPAESDVWDGVVEED